MFSTFVDQNTDHEKYLLKCGVIHSDGCLSGSNGNFGFFKRASSFCSQVVLQDFCFLIHLLQKKNQNYVKNELLTLKIYIVSNVYYLHGLLYFTCNIKF